MIAFAVLAGILVLGAWLFVLPPLFAGRDRRGDAPGSAALAVLREQLLELENDRQRLGEAEYAQARDDLERRVLAEAPEDTPGGWQVAPRRGVALGLALGIPLLAALGYGALGNPAALDQARLEGDGAHSRQQMEERVAALAAKVQAAPDNLEGWLMLARSQVSLGRYGEGAAAYAKVVDRVPDDPQLLADYADALSAAQGRKLRGVPAAIIARALAAGPSHPKTLALAGSLAFEEKNYAEAARHWRSLLQNLPEGSELAGSIQSSLEEAERRNAEAPPDGQGQAKTVASAPAGVAGQVVLAAGASAQVQPEHTVFVFARPAGGGSPVAVMRAQVKDLPLQFHLEPSDKSVGQGALQVVARISRSGEASPQPGDWQGIAAPAPWGSNGVRVEINQLIKPGRG